MLDKQNKITHEQISQLSENSSSDTGRINDSDQLRGVLGTETGDIFFTCIFFADLLDLYEMKSL